MSDFDEFARKCPHKVGDVRGEAVCNYHESSPGDCRRELCPLFKKMKE